MNPLQRGAFNPPAATLLTTPEKALGEDRWQGDQAWDNALAWFRAQGISQQTLAVCGAGVTTVPHRATGAPVSDW